jgi:hypothetical protein
MFGLSRKAMENCAKDQSSNPMSWHLLSLRETAFLVAPRRQEKHFAGSGPE